MQGPRVLKVDPQRPEEEAIAEAARVLRGGGLVAFPTETVYGLGALATDAAAVARVFWAKGRPHAHPLIAHVEGEPGARALASEWPERASRLARAFWPGPLTLIVSRAPHVPSAVSGGLDSLAVRAPAHPVARALLAALGAPIAAPSANRFQEISPTSAAHVVKSLGAAVDLVLDGGACARGIESTVLDVRRSPCVVLRPGPVDLAAIRTIEAAEGGARSVSAEDARPSPGMDARHYAPRARLELLPTLAAVAARARALGGSRVGVLARSAVDVSVAAQVVAAGEPEGYARSLYAALHALDDAGVEVILVEAVPAEPAWRAVADRLARASA